MIENKYIRFDPSCWGYEFTCVQCGANASTEGEAPLSAVDAMREKGWSFHLENNTYRPICPACDHSGGDSA